MDFFRCCFIVWCIILENTTSDLSSGTPLNVSISSKQSETFFEVKDGRGA